MSTSTGLYSSAGFSVSSAGSSPAASGKTGWDVRRDGDQYYFLRLWSYDLNQNIRNLTQSLRVHFMKLHPPTTLRNETSAVDV